MSHIVVVGAGLSGSIAALSAKEHAPDADVTLLSTAPERYRYESGLLGVLGYTNGKDHPIESPLESFATLSETHPYRRIGEGAMRDGLAFFDNLFDAESSLSYSSGTEQNALVPTTVGNVRPVSRYPEANSAGLVSDQRPMHIVGFNELTHLDAEFVAECLDSTMPYDVDWSTVPLPDQLSEMTALAEIGRTLDTSLDDSQQQVCKDLAAAVRPELDIEPRVGFPAMLGVENHAAVRSEVASSLHAEVFEIPAAEPHVGGLRLKRALRTLVEEAGIEQANVTVREFDSESGTIQSLSVHKEDTEESTRISGDVFVLATGGVAAGGLVGTPTGVREPIFDCSITGPSKPSAWSDSQALGDHPFASFGVDVTAEFQPASPSGEATYENLHAVGTVLGGHNAVQEESRGGVAIATGYSVGKDIAERY
ncbi:glycerol-3-phosphate dehydrogenase subunit GlpB [Halovenus rubra]|uniref:Glycerol-3-phosphate dehydrogenase subunit GlpB n=2 Tax=Halovenus rubra TaxID=869890 RepID=A0ABD5XAK1_9EURY|nr:glycerol-3-phosphate dehydrogenase subunit GlpB [Halovenus rubra]